MNAIKQAWSNVDKLRMFEIPHNGELYIFNIGIVGDNFEAIGEINVVQPIDEDFSLDENLEGLYDKVLLALFERIPFIPALNT